MSNQFEKFVSIDQHCVTLMAESADWAGSFDEDNEDPYQVGVGVAPGVVGITNAPRGGGEAPVLIEVVDGPPDDAEIEDYDLVADASIDAGTGELLVVNENGRFAAVSVSPGIHGVRISYGNADACTYDGGDGADHYRITIWAGKPVKGVVVRKEFSPDDEWSKEYSGSRSRSALRGWLKDTSSQPAAISRRCLATVALLRKGDFAAVRKAQEKEASLSVRAVYASAVWLADEAEGELARLARSESAVIRKRVVESSLLRSGPAAWKLVKSLAADPDETVRVVVKDALEDRAFKASAKA